jgi:hypothetical protein
VLSLEEPKVYQQQIYNTIRSLLTDEAIGDNSLGQLIENFVRLCNEGFACLFAVLLARHLVPLV